MLIALLTLLFLGGGSTNAVLTYIADSKPVIKETVADETRRAEALATLKAMKGVQQNHAKVVNKSIKALKKELAAGTDTNTEAFWQDYFASKQVSDEQMIDLRFQLRDQLTREEWDTIFPTDSAAN